MLELARLMDTSEAGATKSRAARASKSSTAKQSTATAGRRAFRPCPGRRTARLRKDRGGLGRSADARPALSRQCAPSTLSSYCAPYCEAPKSSGSGETDAKKEQQEPDEDSKGYDCCSHKHSLPSALSFYAGAGQRSNTDSRVMRRSTASRLLSFSSMRSSRPSARGCRTTRGARLEPIRGDAPRLPHWVSALEAHDGSPSRRRGLSTRALVAVSVTGFRKPMTDDVARGHDPDDEPSAQRVARVLRR
jgi:hypothetical protein